MHFPLMLSRTYSSLIKSYVTEAYTQNCAELCWFICNELTSKLIITFLCQHISSYSEWTWWKLQLTWPGAFFNWQRLAKPTSVFGLGWIIFILVKQWDVITHPCSSSNSSLFHVTNGFALVGLLVASQNISIRVSNCFFSKCCYDWAIPV